MLYNRAKEGHLLNLSDASHPRLALTHMIGRSMKGEGEVMLSMIEMETFTSSGQQAAGTPGTN